ncbi:NAD(P)-dependent oxidoreductase [Embleya hyalina]|uniref:Dehydrogenase n=1 Tax=Embleya hyalina TaxID=516124 RepID=A0A401YIT5_9ACTN|nr:NAD(P)-dependent oxidoreductase [Embleya hyalina]GCD94532.1 dehydrogenase [Embleya hyalina]
MTNTRPTVAVLGTGIIGAALARNLARAGFAVRAWNRSPEKAAALVPDGVTAAETPADAVTGADLVLTALNDGPRVLDAMRAAVPGLRKGTTWVQVSTVGVDAFAELAEFARARGLFLVDAPVQGTRGPAEQGKLVILAAGEPGIRDRVQPLFDTIGQRTMWVGEDGTSGTASRLKLVLNTWVLALTHGVGETLALAKGLEVDPKLVFDAITGGPLDNPYFQLKGAAILADEYTPSFTVDNAEKDARLVLRAAEHAGVRMDVVAAGAERLHRASAQGHGDKDMAATYLASFDG